MMTRSVLALACAFLGSGPALAGADHEAAFNLCVAQPTLQAEILVPIIEEKMSKPHPPVLDGLSEGQILNAVQYYQGEICASELMDHPDVVAAIAAQQSRSRSAWEEAWVAFNTYCQQNLQASCINAEVDAGEAIREANTGQGGETPASRACALALSGDTDPLGWKHCMDVVGDQHPSEDVIQRCLFATKWHSQTDPVVAGRGIADCFRKQGN